MSKNIIYCTQSEEQKDFFTSKFQQRVYLQRVESFKQAES